MAILNKDSTVGGKKILDVDHEKQSVTSEETHGLRVTDDKLEFFNGTVWKIASGGIPVGNVTELSITQLVGNKLEIKWTDPDNRLLDDEIIAEWKGTKVVRKVGGYPFNVSDGETVMDSTTKNKYKTTGFVDEDLTDGTRYYYMLFPYTDEVETIDGANRVDEISVSKFTKKAPNAPTVSDIEFDKATVTGASGSVVSIDKTNWFSTPKTFTGLTAETAYNAYVKFEETATHLESPLSAGKSFTTPSEAPGPSDIIDGDESAGFYGEVPASELFTGSEIASACGITQGTRHNNTVNWFKYTIDGKVCFRPLKSIRHSISWDEIESANCVYGDSGGKVVEKNGMRFKVRLMKGALTDPSKYDDSDRGAKGSEWNKIMLPISKKAIDQSWQYSQYVESSVPAWKHGFGTGTSGMYTDGDLGFVSGNGYRHWCQETRGGKTSNRVIRGNNYGPSHSYSYTSSISGSGIGWAPILELIE